MDDRSSQLEAGNKILKKLKRKSKNSLSSLDKSNSSVSLSAYGSNEVISADTPPTQPEQSEMAEVEDPFDDKNQAISGKVEGESFSELLASSEYLSGKATESVNDSPTDDNPSTTNDSPTLSHPQPSSGNDDMKQYYESRLRLAEDEVAKCRFTINDLELTVTKLLKNDQMQQVAAKNRMDALVAENTRLKHEIIVASEKYRSAEIQLAKLQHSQKSIEVVSRSVSPPKSPLRDEWKEKYIDSCMKVTELIKERRDLQEELERVRTVSSPAKSVGKLARSVVDLKMENESLTMRNKQLLHVVGKLSKLALSNPASQPHLQSHQNNIRLY